MKQMEKNVHLNLIPWNYITELFHLIIYENINETDMY